MAGADALSEVIIVVFAFTACCAGLGLYSRRASGYA